MAWHDIDIKNSVPATPLHDDVFSKMDSIIPDGHLEIQDKKLLDED